MGAIKQKLWIDEGGDETTSLIPHFSAGGVTIGAGLDLSRWGKESDKNFNRIDAIDQFTDFIDNAGITGAEKTELLKLTDALGKTGQDAQDWADLNKGITISGDTSKKLFDRAYTDIEEKVKIHYEDKNASGKINYDALPDREKEILMTAGYQYGAGATPGLYTAMRKDQESGDTSFFSVQEELGSWGQKVTKNMNQNLVNRINDRYEALGELAYGREEEKQEFLGQQKAMGEEFGEGAIPEAYEGSGMQVTDEPISPEEGPMILQNEPLEDIPGYPSDDTPVRQTSGERLPAPEPTYTQEDTPNKSFREKMEARNWSGDKANKVIKEKIKESPDAIAKAAGSASGNMTDMIWGFIMKEFGGSDLSVKDKLIKGALRNQYSEGKPKKSKRVEDNIMNNLLRMK